MMFGFFKKKVPQFNVIYRAEPQMDLVKVEKTNQCKRNDLKHFNRSKEKTIKNCPAFMLSRSVGFVVVNPFSFDVTIHQDSRIEIEVFNDALRDRVNVHKPCEHEVFYEGYVPIQVRNDIFIRESTGVKCLYAAAITENHKLSNDVAVPTGMIEFKNNNSINLFYLLRKPDSGSKTYSFVMGDPALKIMPMCEDYTLNHKIDRFFDGINAYVYPGNKAKYLLTRKMTKNTDRHTEDGE